MRLGPEDRHRGGEATFQDDRKKLSIELHAMDAMDAMECMSRVGFDVGGHGRMLFNVRRQTLVYAIPNPAMLSTWPSSDPSGTTSHVPLHVHIYEAADAIFLPSQDRASRISPIAAVSGRNLGQQSVGF